MADQLRTDRSRFNQPDHTWVDPKDAPVDGLKAPQMLQAYAPTPYDIQFMTLDMNYAHWRVGTVIFGIKLEKLAAPLLIDIPSLRNLFVDSTVKKILARIGTTKRAFSEFDMNSSIDTDFMPDIKTAREKLYLVGICGDVPKPYAIRSVNMNDLSRFNRDRPKVMTVIQKGKTHTPEEFEKCFGIVPPAKVFYILREISVLQVDQWETLRKIKEANEKFNAHLIDKKLPAEDLAYESFLTLVPYTSPENRLPRSVSLEEALDPETRSQQTSLDCKTFKHWLRDKNGKVRLNAEGKPIFELREGLVFELGCAVQPVPPTYDTTVDKRTLTYKTVHETHQLSTLELWVDVKMHK